MLSKINKRVLLFVLIIIAIILYGLLFIPISQRSKLDAFELLKQTQEELFELKKRHIQLQKTIDAKVQNLKKYKVPTFVYESNRRKVMQTIQEFWYFIIYQMKKLKNIFNRNKNSLSIVEKVLSVVFESKRALLTNMEKLTEVDGFNAWRNKESADLSNIVQPFAKSSKLHECQKIVCPINYRCGLGCQMHHLIHSMILAYGLERTLILESKNWQYHEGGWDKVFLPLSSSCTTISNVPTVNWPGSNVSRVIRLRPTTRVTPRSQYLPLAVPEDLVNRIKIIHGNPIAWWVGQIIKYVWRLQPRTTDYINNQMEKFGIKNPFVGVQIRRTDKIYYAEAKYQAVERYMDVVDEYYNSIETKTNFTKRRVYIATEEYSVIKEVKTKYPHYEILHNQNIPKIPKINFARSFDNIFDLILDVHILLRSDLLVCTLTSNLCRLIYALLQNDHVDGSANIVSLDAVYWYHNQLHNKRKVILKHHPENAAEIDLVPGDIVDVTVVTDYSLNGYSHGTNLRTRRKGWYPSFKVEIEIEIVKFPTYFEIDNKETIT